MPFEKKLRRNSRSRGKHVTLSDRSKVGCALIKIKGILFCIVSVLYYLCIINDSQGTIRTTDWHARLGGSDADAGKPEQYGAEADGACDEGRGVDGLGE